MHRIINKNLGLYFEIATNGYKGGDGGHGSRTYFLIDILEQEKRYEIKKKLLTYYNFDCNRKKTFYNGFYIYLAGDWELEAFENFLKFIYRVINYLSTGKKYKSLIVKEESNNEIVFTLKKNFLHWTSYYKARFKNNHLYVRFIDKSGELFIEDKINSKNSVTSFNFYIFDLKYKDIKELKKVFFNINVMFYNLIYNRTINIEKYLVK